MFLNVIERVSWWTLASMVWDIRAHRKQRSAGVAVKKVDAQSAPLHASTNFYFSRLCEIKHAIGASRQRPAESDTRPEPPQNSGTIR